MIKYTGKNREECYLIELRGLNVVSDREQINAIVRNRAAQKLILKHDLLILFFEEEIYRAPHDKPGTVKGKVFSHLIALKYTLLPDIVLMRHKKQFLNKI